MAQVRRILGERKIGHLGTLDPAASGLLVMAVGAKALKVVELFNELPKAYEAHICFGAVSTTYDREGVIEQILRKPGVDEPTEITIRNTIEDRFLGKVEQIPPAYSAVKVGGERAYRKMRQGRGVNIPPREVEITECDIVAYAYPNLTLRVACSSGTYIRSLAHDLGQVLRCGGYLAGLKRTQVGEWSVQDAVALDDVQWVHVVPLKDILAARPQVQLTPQQMTDIRNGRNIPFTVTPSTIAWFEDLPVAVVDPAKDGSGQAHARKVL